ncbi:MAG: Fis family transcriptional regulator [Desulfobacterales bacterium RIFOXYA12_FULL_46_15]|nr:MAG: Fis family transcriptional regulator [Desulfobacterales bacterium RIFOXYA12_FULL_46_15]
MIDVLSYLVFDSYQEPELVDNNSFFRNAILKISSSLELEKALWECLWYFQDILPVSQLAVFLYDQETGITEGIAHADLKQHKAMSVKIQISPEGRRQIETQRSIRVRIMSNTSKDPVGLAICKVMGCLDLSVIAMDLVIENQFLGAIGFFSFPGETFTKKHTDLISQLNDPFAIAVSNSTRYREIQEYKDLLEDDNRYLHKELRRIGGEEVIGAEFGLKGVMDLVEHVAPMDSPVLLLGETGVGKELIAKSIHNLSLKRDKPFIEVNCGAIPESLMDSELFGHEKGAFTGAISRKRGKFERAQGGSIFLDEIGELSLEAQVRLLRVLQEKKIERVGGKGPISLDIRVIAATHRDLDKMMDQGRFRQDLFFRLKVFPIFIPPLRERKSDIPSLVHHFLQKKSTQMNLRFTPKLTTEAIDNLLGYHWPGNVRELENTVERALILSHGKPISFEGIVFPGSDSKPLGAFHTLKKNKDSELPCKDTLNLDSVMEQHIKRVLTIAGGRVDGKGGAAELLQINPRTLRHRMKKLKIPFGRGAKGIYSLP